MSVSDLNLVVVSGRLTRDPEARGGGKVAAFGIASNRFFRRDDAETTTEETVFIDCTAFGFEAEAVLTKLSKGAPCTIEGRLELNRWIGEDGTNRSQLRVIANRVTSPAMRTKPADAAQAEADQQKLAENATEMAEQEPAAA